MSLADDHEDLSWPVISSLWERPVVLQCVDPRRTVLDSEFSALCMAYFVLQEAPVDMFL